MCEIRQPVLPESRVLKWAVVRGGECAGVQGATQGLILWVRTHADRPDAHEMGIFGGSPGAKTICMSKALYLYISRSPLAAFLVNVGRLFTVQITLGCRWALLDSAFSFWSLLCPWHISFYKERKDRKERTMSARIQKARFFPASCLAHFGSIMTWLQVDGQVRC